ncbi:hypothetical protein C0991_012500 [Blastosporella zonata]|nr:hypothetical protein C0991_012500 [Blastosporella zonata]
MSTHTSFDRNCPAFTKRCEDLETRFPENTMPYFPILHDDTTWIMAPPKFSTKAPTHRARIAAMEAALAPATATPTSSSRLPPIFSFSPSAATNLAPATDQTPQTQSTQSTIGPTGTANRQTNLLTFNFTAPRTSEPQRKRRRRSSSPPVLSYE